MFLVSLEIKVIPNTRLEIGRCAYAGELQKKCNTTWESLLGPVQKIMPNWVSQWSVRVASATIRLLLTRYMNKTCWGTDCTLPKFWCWFCHHSWDEIASKYQTWISQTWNWKLRICWSAAEKMYKFKQVYWNLVYVYVILLRFFYWVNALHMSPHCWSSPSAIS